MSIQTHPYAYIDEICGRPAFFRVGVPIATDPLIAAHFERVDGSTPVPADYLACSSCGRYMGEDLRLGKLIAPGAWVRRDTLDSSITTQQPNETQDPK